MSSSSGHFNSFYLSCFCSQYTGCNPGPVRYCSFNAEVIIKIVVDREFKSSVRKIIVYRFATEHTAHCNRGKIVDSV